MTKDNRPSYNSLLIPDVRGPLGLPSHAASVPLPARDKDNTAYQQTKAKDTWRSVEKAAQQGKPLSGSAAIPESGGQTATINSDNYQKSYLANKAKRERDEQQARNETAQGVAAKQREETDKILQLRNQAVEIRNQMGIWENMRDQGTHDKQTIDGQLQLLQAELDAIPPDYQT